MKNSNIIISVIIVLCIAGGVTAYSITNPKGEVSNLLGYIPTDNNNPDDGSSSVNGVNNGFSSNGGGNSSGGNGNGGNSGSSTKKGSSNKGNVNPTHNGIIASQAKSIAQGAIEEEGAYVGTPYWDSFMSMWVVKVYDKNGNVVGGIGVDANRHTNKV